MNTKLIFSLGCSLVLGAPVRAEAPAIDTSPVSVTSKYESNPGVFDLPGKGMVIALQSHMEGDALFLAQSKKSLMEKDCDLTLKDSTGVTLGKLQWHDIRMEEEVGQDALFSVKIDRLPTQGAEWIKVEGNVFFAALSGRTVSKPYALSFAKNKRISATINGIRFQFSKDGTESVSVQATLRKGATPFDLQFLRADGSKIPVRSNGSMKMSDSSGTTISTHYIIEQMPEQMNVSIATWKEAAKVKVPVDVKISLDLSK